MKKIIEINNSSLLSLVIYNYEKEELTVTFTEKYFTQKITYEDVPSILFEEMELNRLNSYGKFYLQQIKPNFKQKTSYKQMSDTKQMPKGVNVASDKKRYIRMRLNLTALNKEWFTQGKEKDGKIPVYTDLVLQMLPDGDVDKYENLGMITQEVPKEVYKADKEVKGAIIGNGRENVWENSGAGVESIPGAPLSAASSDVVDDLPF